MERVERISYSPSLNKLDLNIQKGFALYDCMHPEVVSKCLSRLVEKIEAEEDIILDSFLASYRYIEIFDPSVETHLCIFIYPKHGTINCYQLYRHGEFYSNVHTYRDPIVIKEIRSDLHVHPTRIDKNLYIHGYPLDNIIEGAFLFKKNPFDHMEEYDGFKEFVEATPEYLCKLP